MIKQLKLASLLTLSFLAILIFSTTDLVAQDAEITDDDLKRYAVVMNKIDSMKNGMKVRYNELIKGEEAMKGGKRFKELKSANGDEAKLAEINATEEEISIYNRIQDEYAKMTSDFKAAYPQVIKDELGAGVYNKVKKALKADEAIKAKYDAIVESMTSEESTEGDT